jgi:isoleucyl-tRNA synthetase
MTGRASDTTSVSYKDTLNLPETGFDMKANLVANEPVRLAAWRAMNLYDKVQAERGKGNKGKWILHDGPPFANGDIHIGHLINKTLKDVILRFRTMQGYQTPYVPGWDCHGLPIEHKIQQDLGPKLRELSTVDIRRRCYDYAAKYVAIQSEQFQRLGILGAWDKPYLTMSPDYESRVLEVFARFVGAGLVHKKLKPVAWSIENQTALADAELEYQDITDPSVFVEFPFDDQASAQRAFGLSSHPVNLLIWTTTPWTLPANLAVAVHPDVAYMFVTSGAGENARTCLVAADLVEKVFALRGTDQPVQWQRGPTIKGRDLVDSKLAYRHPFIDRLGKIVAADYVTTTDGTGLVHTAPGHGEDDYETGVREGLDVYSPVLANGRFDDTAPQWLRGKKVKEANPIIIGKLRESGRLFAELPITHSYPHDWRSKTPVIFRATEQWFIALDKPFAAPDETAAGATLRDRALSACASRIAFVPEWGRHRIEGMLKSRPDWCVSRQRAWGLPIPVFYNEQGDALLTPESVRAVARQFAVGGSEAWFTLTPAQLLGDDFVCPPGFSLDSLRKEKDIFDVWFESGSSWNAVLKQRPELHFPAELYLEGSDQHRGWFQLSLLPSLGATGRPPFRSVLTHGFVVKPDGTKVSKSDKEYVTATQEINRHGADVLRLWTSSVDYQGDIPTSPRAIEEFADKYRKIRNTVRYLLSNLTGYDAAPAADVPAASLDGWISAELDELVRQTTSAYDTYQIHRVFRLLHDFCAVQISSLYGNAMKDRLYCEPVDSIPRRRCQGVMHRIANDLIRLLAPILVFTADEAWQHLPGRNLQSVHLALLPEPSGAVVSDIQRDEWRLLMGLRDSALMQLDRLKKDAGLNKSVDAEIVYCVDEPLRNRLAAYGPDLEDIAGVGFHSFEPAVGGSPSVRVVDRRQDYKACARSWKRRPDVGADPRFPDLCARDAAAVAILRDKKP